MENKNIENGSFSYTYSAKEQSEIMRIRQKYTSPARSEDKMDRLRALDASVTRTSQGVSVAIGIIGALMLGLGMSLIMTELPNMLGLSGSLSMTLGVVIGVAGAALVSLAYPIYSAVSKAKRKKIAPEIIRLTDELMKG